MNKDQKNEVVTGKSEAGFIKTIVLIVIILIILKFIGFDISNIWSSYIFPILNSGWNILVWIANILYGFLKVFINLFQLIVDFGDKVIQG